MDGMCASGMYLPACFHLGEVQSTFTVLLASMDHSRLSSNICFSNPLSDLLVKTVVKVYFREVISISYVFLSLSTTCCLASFPLVSFSLNNLFRIQLYMNICEEDIHCNFNELHPSLSL